MKIFSLQVLGLVIALSACSNDFLGKSGSAADERVATKDIESVYASINKSKINSEPKRLAAEGIKALEANQLTEASTLFNRALKLDVSNSYLQFLNGMTYHLQALDGDSTKFDLAQQGYELAVQYDKNNWLARYQMGQLYLDQKNFGMAQRHLAEAAHYKFDDPDILYSLAVSSYYAQDPETAAGALSKLRQLKPNDPKVVKASAVVSAALNEKGDAQKFLFQYQASKSPLKEVIGLSSRLGQWGRYHQRIGGQENIQLAQADTESENSDGGEESSEDAEVDENKMAIVDVVIIRSEEDLNTSKGVNLLSGLQLQFGSTDASTAGFSVSSSSQKSADTPGLTKTITRALNIPKIDYSLNIANANTTRHEILARPTLVALAGEASEFFSGLSIQASAVAADSTSISLEKEIGVKLIVTPTFLEDGRVKLAVEAERTFLATPNTTSVTYTLRIDTSKTNVKANVAMNFGETLILSGLSEKETEDTRSGVPGLQDVPLVQYLFSTEATQKFQKSVIVLLTPRRPEFVYQNEKRRQNRLKKLSRSERVLTELQAQYTDWFRPYPNWASIFNHLQANHLYREFRTGDVSLEEWNALTTHSERLKQAAGFLFY